MKLHTLDPTHAQRRERLFVLEPAERTLDRCASPVEALQRSVSRGRVITGTRVPVRTIASLIEMGETREVLREDYPHVPEEAYPVAVLWARANPRRGRPVRPWDSLVPKRRGARGA